jgi:phosphinothricin acetyltransferase
MSDPRPDGLVVRASDPRDIAAIQAIYAQHVLTGLGSFEEVPPDRAEMAVRHAAVRDLGLPWLVAELEGRLLGYCYANLYRARSAYRFTLEDAVYVYPGAQRCGVGRALLSTLIAETSRLGYRQMIAVIGDSGNAGSITLHERAGFRMAGTVEDVGYKFGRWVDIVVMQRALSPQSAPEA